MTDYTANCYGIGRDRKASDDKTTAALRNPFSKVNKGQKCTRLIIAAGDLTGVNKILGGELWVHEGTTLANADTLTITVTTTPDTTIT
jgi:hypothetical protein